MISRVLFGIFQQLPVFVPPRNKISDVVVSYARGQPRFTAASEEKLSGILGFDIDQVRQHMSDYAA